MFPQGTFESDTLSASGGTFRTIVPFGGQLLDIAIQDAEIGAMHSGLTDAGIGYEGGTVTGYILPEQLVVAVDGVLQG